MFVAELRTISPSQLVTARTFPAISCVFARNLGSPCMGPTSCQCLAVINAWAVRVKAWPAEQRATTRLEALRRLIDAGTIKAWPMAMSDGVERLCLWERLLISADSPQDSFSERFESAKAALRDVLAQRHTAVLDPQSMFAPVLAPNSHFWGRFWPAAAQLLTSADFGFGTPCPAWALEPVRVPAGSWYALKYPTDAEMEELERRTLPQFARYRIFLDLELPD